MHLPLIFAIALLVITVCALGFFWLFRSDKLRRMAYTKSQAKFYRRDD